jgi:hypothetical protein
VEILTALGRLGRGNAAVVSALNRFLESENNSFKRGNPAPLNLSFDSTNRESSRELAVLRACISTLGILGDTSSFPFLFSAMTAGYPQAVIQETLKALESLQGNYTGYLIDIVRRNPFPEKAAAFRIGAYNEKLKPAERAEIAQAALEASLNLKNPAENSLRYDAITVLTRLKWTPAAQLAIRNFYLVQADYISGTVPRERLLEAIACLGVMRNSEAAGTLAMQLGYLNSRAESSNEYDEAVVLALINALGELGDKAAFDSLLYISYLNYPDKIQSAAREALNRLRW